MGRILWACLLGLVLLFAQQQALSHELEHAGPVHEHCSACDAIAGLGAALPVAAVELGLRAQRFAAPPSCIARGTVAGAPAAYDSRAPPLKN